MVGGSRVGHSREVGRFSEGSLGEVSLYSGRFAVQMPVRHVKCNVYVQDIQTYGVGL